MNEKKQGENKLEENELAIIKNKIHNLTYIVIIGFVITILLIIGLYFQNPTNQDSSPNDDNSGETTNTAYDVSNMPKVDVNAAVSLFNEKGFQVLYIGRENCGVCVQIVPILNKLQKEFNYKTNYFDLNSTSNWQTEMKPLTDLLTFKTTVKTTVKDKDGNSKAVTLNDTVGNIFHDYGFTPTIAILKDGKMVDGFIGYKDYDAIKKILEKYI